jgi:hypothetical protein
MFGVTGREQGRRKAGREYLVIAELQAGTTACIQPLLLLLPNMLPPCCCCCSCSCCFLSNFQLHWLAPPTIGAVDSHMLLVLLLLPNCPNPL